MYIIRYTFFFPVTYVCVCVCWVDIKVSFEILIYHKQTFDIVNIKEIS